MNLTCRKAAKILYILSCALSIIIAVLYFFVGLRRLYALLLAILTLVVYLAAIKIYNIREADDRKKRRFAKLCMIAISILYIILLLYLMFFNELRSASAAINSNTGNTARYNLIPFKTISEFYSIGGQGFYKAALVNILGNIIVFMPMGIILPLAFQAQRKSGIFMVTSLGILLLIEFLQMLLGVGVFDIDDIILNFIGAALIYMLFKMKNFREKIFQFFGFIKSTNAK